ncbi:glycerophosphoryl diester phosphodiesterase membrane domain-containing protein [Parabacteroides sp. Marseille-P3160]|uniref:glycerophosphoryl diester phosphodiesterase membrane domain-containing protein n=1 Tax=Parabacteroides sp. Marseille-P3160 TaxID=1917887 RepID=UPI0009BB02A3|nr:glycerophosphoryl diester phosphodiesterase membrane domain-containing protein [Parabacteroides sp. Marseille-P3160]
MKQQIVISEALKAAWKSLKEQIWILVGLLVGYTIIYFLLNIFTPTNEVGAPKGITGGVMYFVSFAFTTLFYLGYIKNLFQALDGEEPQFSAYGQQSGKILKGMITSILYSLIMVIGLCLLIIPGIYLGLRLQFAFYFIVEENTGILDSLKKSWTITKGQVFPLFLLLLVGIGIVILGIIALGIGVFVAIPLIFMASCYVFRKLNAPAASILEEEGTFLAKAEN